MHIIYFVSKDRVFFIQNHKCKMKITCRKEASYREINECFNIFIKDIEIVTVRRVEDGILDTRKGLFLRQKSVDETLFFFFISTVKINVIPRIFVRWVLNYKKEGIQM